MNVSTKRIRKTAEELCQFENRIAGTKTEKEAANYLTTLLSDIGYDVVEQEFSIIAWEPQELLVEIVSPEMRTLECALFPNSPSVKQRVVLVDLEIEQQQKPSGMPLYGFAEWGESLYTSPDIPYNKAIDQGLNGLIISSPDDGELVKVRVGNHGKQLQIPIISVSKENGETLKKMMEKSQVTLDVKCVTRRDPSKSYNLEAVLEGSHPDFDIIVSAHYDAWFSGAADNAAPVAIAIEVARQLREYVEQGGTIRRTIRFLLFGAEEGGSERAIFWLNGSRNYVESQKYLNQFALIVNLDSVGYEATNYVGTTYELLDFSKWVSTTMKQEGRFSHYSPPANGSDHWFFTIGGVPTVYLISWPSHLYHTQKDIPEFLDYESIQAYAEYALHFVTEFTNAEVLPLDVIATIEFLGKRVEEMEKTEGNPFSLQELSDSLTGILEFRESIEHFARTALGTKNEKDIAKMNGFLIRTARRINRAIGPVAGVHEARYLPHLELIHEYMTINSVLLALEEKPFMKIHPRTLASLKEYDDTPNKLVDVIGAVMDLRKECNRLADLINKEIAAMLSNLRETHIDLEKLLTQS